MQVAGQSYTWDNANGINGITQSGTLNTTSVAFANDNSNRRTSLTLPNGIVLSYTYDSDSRITAMSWMNGVTQVGDLEYSYDADGRVIEKTGTLAATGIPSAVSGNTFNAANEMTAFNGTPLTYDLNGNLLNDGTNTYTWDARNHLATLTGSGTLPTGGSFIYDAVGRRLEKTINQQTTAFLYDGWNPVQELAPSGLGQFASTANMLTGLGIDEFFQRSDVNGAQSFISDALGSTLALTNPAGSISTSYTYEPFGNVGINPSATNTNPYQFTGRENDGTGLYAFRARYMAPGAGRFISEDPVEFDGGLNLFQALDDNPVSYVDPLGLDPGDIFKTPDEAACDAVQYIRKTFKDTDQREYGGKIAPFHGGFTYIKIYKGPLGGGYVQVPVREDEFPFHTHPKCCPNFSQHDVGVSNSQGRTIYLGSPTGQVLKHPPHKKSKTCQCR